MHRHTGGGVRNNANTIERSVSWQRTCAGRSLDEGEGQRLAGAALRSGAQVACCHLPNIAWATVTTPAKTVVKMLTRKCCPVHSNMCWMGMQLPTQKHTKLSQGAAALTSMAPSWVWSYCERRYSTKVRCATSGGHISRICCTLSAPTSASRSGCRMASASCAKRQSQRQQQALSQPCEYAQGQCYCTQL